MKTFSIFLCLLLAGCTKTIMVPGPVEYRDRLKIQPIDTSLLVVKEIPKGPPSQCLDIAKERGTLLAEAYAVFELLRKQQEK